MNQQDSGACMEWTWRWNPFRNSMPGSRVGARVVSRVSTLLAAMGKLGRLASLGGRPQTLSSGCGTSSIQWPRVEILQPGAHRTLKREGKAPVLSSPITCPSIWRWAQAFRNTPSVKHPHPSLSPCQVMDDKTQFKFFSPPPPTPAFSQTQPNCHQGS